MAWIIFLLSVAIIVAAGTKLSHYGDRIVDYTGLGRLWLVRRADGRRHAAPEVFTAIPTGLSEY